jgi:hypothetical protein
MSQENLTEKSSGVTIENEQYIRKENIRGFAFDWDNTIASSRSGAGRGYSEGLDDEMIHVMFDLKNSGYTVIILSEKPRRQILVALQQLTKLSLATIFPINSKEIISDSEAIDVIWNYTFSNKDEKIVKKNPLDFDCNVLIDDDIEYGLFHPYENGLAIMRKGINTDCWGSQVRQTLIELGVFEK